MGPAGVGNRDGGEWLTDQHEVVALVRVLVETDQLGDCQHRVVDYFCEPQRWRYAYRVWCTMGRPDGPGHRRFHELMMRFFAEGSALRA
jgi:hypothetical protein